MKIMGIDPGSVYTAFGIVKGEELIGSGLLKLGHGSIAGRLKKIFLGIDSALKKYKIDEVVIEGGFLGKNVSSAIKLGQARAVAILASELHGIPIYEYSPREIKLSVVGYGAAQKNQIAYMVNKILNMKNETSYSEHEMDALATAICHIHASKIPEIKINNLLT